MKNNGKVLLFYILFFIAIIIAASAIASGNQTEEIQYSQVVKLFQEEKVESGKIDQNYVLELKLRDNDIVNTKNNTITYKLTNYEIFHRDVGELILQQIKENTIVSFDYEPPTTFPWWVSFLPYIIVIVIMVAVWWMFISRATKGTGGGGLGGRMNSFSKARTKLGTDEKKKVFFTDVAGADEEKQELQEVVEFLKNPTKFSDLGARIPKGVLLVGAPGTGKT